MNTLMRDCERQVGFLTELITGYERIKYAAWMEIRGSRWKAIGPASALSCFEKSGFALEIS